MKHPLATHPLVTWAENLETQRQRAIIRAHMPNKPYKIVDNTNYNPQASRVSLSASVETSRKTYKADVNTIMAWAFKDGMIYKKRANTVVQSTTRPNGDTVTNMRLYGHEIARRFGDKLQVSLCGYNTQTTRRRLNALLAEFFGGPKEQHLRFSQRNFCAAFAGVEIAANDVIEIDMSYIGRITWRNAGSD